MEVGNSDEDVIQDASDSDESDDEPFDFGLNAERDPAHNNEEPWYYHAHFPSNSLNGVGIPPPLPLYKFNSPHFRDWSKIRIVGGAEIVSIMNNFGQPMDSIPMYSNNSSIIAGNNDNSVHLHDPLRSRLLGKWFSSRCLREYWWQQRGSLMIQTLEHQEFLLSLDDTFSLVETQVYSFNILSKIPSQAITPADDDVVFSANFESSNLLRSTRVKNRDAFVKPSLSSTHCYPRVVSLEYDLVLRNDLFTAGNIQWFYFEATAPENICEPVAVRFNIVNMKKFDSLYNYGLRPAMLSSHSAQGSWTHGGFDICYYKNYLTDLTPEQIRQIQIAERCGNRKKIRYKHSLSFSYVFRPGEVVYFSHCFPYTYSDLQRYLFELENNPRISQFLVRKLLATTIANNRCDLLTITSRVDVPGAENIISGRPVVVITARVHPGESNSSFIMHGVLEFLTSDNPNAKNLRDNFVFKIVPMLNPDGVIHGNYRCSLSGCDLNRKYADPSDKFHPSIAAVKQLIQQCQEDRKVLLFLDIHGHSKKKNGFAYGCDIVEQPPDLLQASLASNCKEDVLCKRLHCRIFPKILSLLSNSKSGGYFSYEDCKFRVRKSKLGTGRYICWSEFGIENSLTIEVSFCSNGNSRDSKLIKLLDKNSPHLINVSPRSKTSEDTPSSGQSSPRMASGLSVITPSQSERHCLASPMKTTNAASLSLIDGVVGSPGMALRPSKRLESPNLRLDDDVNVAQTDPMHNDYRNELAILDSILLDMSQMTFFTNDDYKNMGRHICLSILAYSNIDLVSSDSCQISQHRSDIDSMPGDFSDEMLKGLMPAGVPARFPVFDESQIAEAIRVPGVYSLSALNAMHRGNHRLGIAQNLRAQAEMEIRLQFQEQHAVLSQSESLTACAVVREREDDDGSDGSDSDPSVDNIFGGKQVERICPDIQTLLVTLHQIQKNPARMKAIKKKLAGRIGKKIDSLLQKSEKSQKSSSAKLATVVAGNQTNSIGLSQSPKDTVKGMTVPRNRLVVRPMSATACSSPGPSPSMPLDRQAYEFSSRASSRERLTALSAPTTSNMQSLKVSRSPAPDENPAAAPTMEVFYRTLLCGGNSFPNSNSAASSPPPTATSSSTPPKPIVRYFANNQSIASIQRVSESRQRPTSAGPLCRVASPLPSSESKGSFIEDNPRPIHPAQRNPSTLMASTSFKAPSPATESPTGTLSHSASFSTQDMVHNVLLNPPEMQKLNSKPPKPSLRPKSSRKKEMGNYEGILTLLTVKGIASNK